MLRSLKCALAPSRWAEFSRNPGPFPSIEIHESSVPVWMRPSSGAIKPTRLMPMPVARQKRKVVKVSFNRPVKSKWAVELKDGQGQFGPFVELLRHQNEYLDFNEPNLPTTDIVERDSSDYFNGAMWRDTLRRQLRFPLLRVDFRTIVIHDQTELCVFSLSQPEQAVPWTDVVEYIAKFNTLCFKYTLEVVKGSEDEDFEYEYDGPPLAIVDDIAISADYDVGLIDNGEPTPHLISLITPYGEISQALFEDGTGNAKSVNRPLSHSFGTQDKINSLKSIKLPTPSEPDDLHASGTYLFERRREMTGYIEEDLGGKEKSAHLVDCGKRS